MHQQRLGVGRFDIFNNGAQRLLGLLRRKTAQSVIAAELNQHPARLVLLKQRWQASQPCCEVSPLMLAFTTGVFACHCSLSSAGRAELAAIR